MKPNLRIAYYQQDIVWEDPAANMAKVEQIFDETKGPIDLMIVPETFTTGFSDNMAAMAEISEGPTYRFALKMAQRHNAMFVGTWTVSEEGNVYNRLHWVKPDGSWGYYDKGHTFRMSSEAVQIAQGTKRELTEWRGWRIKPAICYDLRFPKWLRNDVIAEDRAKLPAGNVAICEETIAMEYDLLIVCANWPATRHEAWSTLLKARAIENLCYVVGVNRVGTDGVGIPYSGNSMVADYRGLPISEAEPGKEQARVAELNYGELQTFRKHWPFYLDFDR